MKQKIVIKDARENKFTDTCKINNICNYRFTFKNKHSIRRIRVRVAAETYELAVKYAYQMLSKKTRSTEIPGKSEYSLRKVEIYRQMIILYD